MDVKTGGIGVRGAQGGTGGHRGGTCPHFLKAQESALFRVTWLPYLKALKMQK